MTETSGETTARQWAYLAASGYESIPTTHHPDRLTSHHPPRESETTMSPTTTLTDTLAGIAAAVPVGLALIGTELAAVVHVVARIGGAA